MAILGRTPVSITLSDEDFNYVKEELNSFGGPVVGERLLDFTWDGIPVESSKIRDGLEARLAELRDKSDMLEVTLELVAPWALVLLRRHGRIKP